jgi:hypothetical protein
MPSNYSQNLRIELIATGEQSGTWGNTTNTNLGTLIEDAISGYIDVSVTSANQALTATDGAADESRNMIVGLNTTGWMSPTNFNVYIPPVDKFYVIRNTSAYAATIYCSTIIGNTSPKGTGVTVAAGKTTILYSDGTDVLTAINAVTSVGWTGGIVSIATADTTPAFTIAGTSGGIPYFSSSSTWASSAALAANAIVLGGGAGNAPATTTTGTGVVTALGNNVNAAGGLTTINGVATLTNKRIDPRASTATSTTSLTPDVSSYDQYNLTAQAATLAINAPIGTPVDGNKLIFRILDNGVAQTLNWNGTYTEIGVTLPVATTPNKMLYVGCIYNAANTRWDVIATSTQA